MSRLRMCNCLLAFLANFDNNKDSRLLNKLIWTYIIDYCIISVDMKDAIISAELIGKYSEDLGGVFQLADLKGLFPLLPSNVFYRRIADLEKARVLKRFARGVYLAKKFDTSTLSQKLCPESYISFESVLAKNLMIGTMPSKELKAVKIGKKRKYIFEDISIVHFGIDKALFFGFKEMDGVNFATKEKALLDTLYFYTKGVTYYFDIYSDIDLKKIDLAMVRKYLSKYKNPKFVKFVKGYLKEDGI